MSDVATTELAISRAQPPLPNPAPLSRAERSAVALISLLQSAVFGWAYVLPWDKFTTFGVLSSCLSLSHAALSLSLIVPALHRFHMPMWRITSSLALLVFAWCTWAVFSSAWFLSRLYGGLGQGLSAALVAVWALLLLVTVPMAAWGLVRTQRTRLRGLFLTTLGALVVTALLGAAPPLEPTNDVNDTQQWDALLRTRIAPLLHTLPRVPKDSAWSAGVAKRPTSCDAAPAGVATALAFFRDRASKLSSRCWQAPTLPELAAKVADGLAELAISDLVVIDRIVSQREVRSHSPLLDPLMLRPGLDGGCVGNRCFAPWQLVAQSAFTTHAPVTFLADLKLGLSLAWLRKQLGRKGDEPFELVAVNTQSVSIDAEGMITPLKRHHPVEIPVDTPTVSNAAAQYAAHIVAAQQANGQFRYTLDPFSGRVDVQNFSIPRQAGTLLVLCELGKPTTEVDQTIRRGLRLLLEHRHVRGDQWALSLDARPKTMRLGDSALPLVAFAACRERMGDEFDDALRGLSTFVLQQQRPDGSFTSSYDWNKQRPRGGEEALYAPGQALLGLTLLHRLSVANPESKGLGNPETLSTAIQRGMNHVAHEHWNTAIYPFFFVEENWNCLTARAALEHQRNDAYERFCIDYMRFKSRLIFDQHSDVAPEFLGGFGFGNVIPPHNTGAAGFGEAMAALLMVKRARGEDTIAEQTLLKSVMAFLLRQQWTPETCFACAPDVVGSMSEHMHSPITRIDFTQHAWAAVGHGAKALGIHAN